MVANIQRWERCTKVKYIIMHTNKKIPLNDWRRQGQEKYLMGEKLIFQNYYPYREGWDHDHCEFCGAKFSLSLNDINEGYAPHDKYHWVCGQCFNDFKEEFHWMYKP